MSIFIISSLDVVLSSSEVGGKTRDGLIIQTTDTKLTTLRSKSVTCAAEELFFTAPSVRCVLECVLRALARPSVGGGGGGRSDNVCLSVRLSCWQCLDL